MEEYKEWVEYNGDVHAGDYAIFYMSKGPMTVNCAYAIRDKEVFESQEKERFLQSARKECKRLLDKASNENIS